MDFCDFVAFSLFLFIAEALNENKGKSGVKNCVDDV